MARTKKGVFSWEDVLAQRYQNNKPPPLPRPRHNANSPHPPHSQPQSALLTRLSPELRLIIWEMALGGQRLHIIQRSNQRLGHIICPLGLGFSPGPDSGSRPRLDYSNKIGRGVGPAFCEICHGAGIAQPVKEGDSGASGGAGRGRDGLLGLVLTCRQMLPIALVGSETLEKARRGFAFTESIHLLYATNAFEFSIPWSLPYLQPTVPPEYWECIRAVELRWSFPGHWLPTKDPVRSIYVSAGRVQWMETCRAVKQLPELRSFVLVLGSSWFSEPVERLPVFLEPLSGLRVVQDRKSQRQNKMLRAKMEVEVDLMEWKRGSRSSSLGEEMSSSESRVSFESRSSSSHLTRSSASSLRSEGSACSCFDSGLMGPVSLSKGDSDCDGDAALATWELRLQGQSYYAHEVRQIAVDLWQRGIDCWVSTI